ncbi:hypothetical protein ACJJTC_005071 [Scirpophaga incertulas]
MVYTCVRSVTLLLKTNWELKTANIERNRSYTYFLTHFKILACSIFFILDKAPTSVIYTYHRYVLVFDEGLCFPVSSSSWSGLLATHHSATDAHHSATDAHHSATDAHYSATDTHHSASGAHPVPPKLTTVPPTLTIVPPTLTTVPATLTQCHQSSPQCHRRSPQCHRRSPQRH